MCDGESECDNNLDESAGTCNESTNKTTWTYRHGTCGGSFTTLNGIFSSPKYPSKYPNNMDCIYTISLKSGTSILLNLVRMDIETYNISNYDYLEIRDGPSESSPLLYRISGSEYPAFLQSDQSHMWLK